MARIKRAVAAKKKRRTVMHRAKGYYGAASRTYKHAKEQVQHSLQYQYRDRRNKKRDDPLSLDHPHQRWRPSERHELLRLHERSEEGWYRPEPQDAG